jgi:formylglycine-generating enzyme required for sulfatase activity
VASALESRSGETMQPIDPASLDPRVRDLPVLVLDDVEGGVRMRFRAIPAGRFVMGSRGYSSSEEPQHTVVIPPIPGRTDDVAFWLAETPVTQRQFRVWAQSRDYEEWREKVGQSETHANHFTDQPDAPAESLNWFEANAYCNWLGSRPWSGDARAVLRGVSIGFGLPTEVEWEYACRAGTDTEFWSGDGDGALVDVGWFEETRVERTQEVGTLAANGFGLFDMHGNVEEWCWDVWDDLAYRSRSSVHTCDSRGRRRPAIHEDPPVVRVVRGGSFAIEPKRCRSAHRDGWLSSIRRPWFGFRVCVNAAVPAHSGDCPVAEAKAHGVEPTNASSR